MNVFIADRWLKNWKPCGSYAITLSVMFMLAGMKAFSQQGTVTTLGNTIGYAGAGTASTTPVLTTSAKFNMPAGLALDPSGANLFLADSNNNAVRWISHLGNKTTSYTTTAFVSTNGISYPVALALDRKTNIYVLNHGTGKNGTILEFNGNLYLNSALKQLVATNASGLTNATSLTLDGLGNIYVTIQSNTVIRITAGNSNKTIVGVITNKATSLKGVVVMSNGQLALTDSGNNGIWIMDPGNTSLSNNSVQLTGFHGAGDILGAPNIAAFNNLQNIALAGNGILIVADRNNNKVKAIDTAGNVTRLFGVKSTQWVGGTPGWNDGTINATEAQDPVEAEQPCGLAIGPDGTVYDTEQHYMLLREAIGTGLTGPGPLPVFYGANGIAFDAAGANLFFANLKNNTVEQLNLGNNLTTTFLTKTNGINLPVSVLLDTRNDVYVLNQNNGTNGYINSFDPYGNLLATNVVGLNQPTAFTLDANGNLIVAQQSGSILIVSPAGATYLLTTVTNAAVSLQGIALFDDGTIAVSDAGNQVIWTVNSITKTLKLLTGQIGISGSTLGASNFAKLFQPHQLARAGNNQLVIADYGNNRLVTVDRFGSITNVLNPASL